MSAARGAGQIRTISELWAALDKPFQEHLEENPNSLFRLLKFKRADLLAKLVCSCVELHYSSTKHVFRFSGVEIGITLEDILYLTGLPIQGEPVIYTKSIDKKAFERVFGEGFRDRKKLRFEEVKAIAVSADQTYRVRKIAVLLIICDCFITPNNNHHEILSQYVQLVEDVDSIDSYAWGAALLSYLYHGLEMFRGGKKNYISGNLWIVLEFLLIRIPKIQEMLGINLETYQQEVIDGAPVLPWIMDKIGKKSRDHCTKHNIKVLPPLSFEDIKWTPYEDMTCPRPGDVNSVTKLVPLIGFNFVQHHMPHHCSEQFEVFQNYYVKSISWEAPAIPPFKQLGGGHEQYFERYYEDQIAQWHVGKPAEYYMRPIERENLFDKNVTILSNKDFKASLASTEDICRRTQFSSRLAKLHEKLRHDIFLNPIRTGLSPDLSGLSADPSDVTRIHTTVNDADICRRRTQFSSRLAKLYEKLRRAKDVSDPRNDVHTEDDVQNLDARMPMNDGEGGGDPLNGMDMEDSVPHSDPIMPMNDGEGGVDPLNGSR